MFKSFLDFVTKSQTSQDNDVLLSSDEFDSVFCTKFLLDSKKFDFFYLPFVWKDWSFLSLSLQCNDWCFLPGVKGEKKDISKGERR